MILLEGDYNCIYGRYVVSGETKRKLLKFCRSNGIQVEQAMEFHCTVVYDERYEAFKYFEKILGVLKKQNPIKTMVNVNAKIIGIDYFGKNKECLVLKLDCKDAHEKWEEYNVKGKFQYSYAIYKPHVTLSYNANNLTLQDKAINELKNIDIKFDRFILEKEGKEPLEPKNSSLNEQSLNLKEIMYIKEAF